jgi:hypothetical protein
MAVQGEGLAAAILANADFRDTLRAITWRSLIDDVPTIVPQLLPSVEWDYALTCASALASVGGEQASDAALRVVQGCLSDQESGPVERQAALVLLERMGNTRAAALAEERDLVGQDAWAQAPGPLVLDVVRRRLELAIPVSSGDVIQANPFQRAFWDRAAANRWLSVSAPTSAGKSYIVKRWIEEMASREESFAAVYLVPTRALIDEVSHDLIDHFDSAVEVFVLPWDHQPGTAAKEIYVLTQERLHLLQSRAHDFVADLLFVDEAQKVGDG